MKALGLFDGMSCGQLALSLEGYPVETYYAAEIDKYAIAVTQHNFPNTVQLGDVTLWKEWDIDWKGIDLVLGGFPCQSWSIAGKQLGDKDERGKMFWIMLDIMKHVLSHNPNAKFLIENVKMKKEFEEYITLHTEEALGTAEKELINSNLLTAQNRPRYYWTNWKVEQPEDLKIMLSDIIESGVVDREKAHCIDANYYKGGNLKSYFEKGRRQLVFEAANGKNVTINAEDIYGVNTFYETRTKFGKKERKRLSKLHGRDTTPRCKNSKHYVVAKHGKANCLVTVDSFLNWIIDKEFYCRKLTVLECERLQSLPDKYTLVLDENGKQLVSNTQRYKMIGNGWTVDVIRHILRSCKDL